MEIIRGLIPFIFITRNPFISYGNFDGVHCGHQVIIRTTVDLARDITKKVQSLSFLLIQL